MTSPSPTPQPTAAGMPNDRPMNAPPPPDSDSSAPQQRTVTFTMPSLGKVGSEAKNAAMLPVSVARHVLPAKKGLPLYMGLGVLAAADVLAWPVAAGIGLGYAVLRHDGGVLSEPAGSAGTPPGTQAAPQPDGQEDAPGAITARMIMTPDVTCIGANESVQVAAEKMTELGVGSLPVCGTDEKLKGMLTDRDIVVKVLGARKDPAQVKAGELVEGDIVTVAADDTADEILRTMSRHKVRRLPVIDGHVLVGIVSQADVARALPDPEVGDLLEDIST